MREKNLQKFSDFFSKRIASMVAQAEDLASLSSPWLRGHFRELLMRDLLEPLIPKSCSVTYGTVVDSEGERFSPESSPRSEDDILIIDRECLPPFFEYEKEGIYPIESVLARIEVKSMLDQESLIDAVLGACKFLQLKPNLKPRVKSSGEIERHPVQVLFSFKYKYKKDTPFERLQKTLEKIKKSEKLRIKLPAIRHLCIPKVGYWAYTKHVTNHLEWRHCKAGGEEYSEVLMFIALLLHELPMVREVRRGSTLGGYIECFQRNRFESVGIP